MVANCGEDLFFPLFLILGKNDFNFRPKTFFLFLVFIQFQRRKYIISTKLFVKLVKAAKAYPHAKFYNLSTGYVQSHIHICKYFKNNVKIKFFNHQEIFKKFQARIWSGKTRVWFQQYQQLIASHQQHCFERSCVARYNDVKIDSSPPSLFWYKAATSVIKRCTAGLEISISNRYYILCFSVTDYRRLFAFIFSIDHRLFYAYCLHVIAW